MAKVISSIKFRGSIGDLCFFENEYGPQVKGKGGPSALQIKNLDAFAKTRHNMAEWKRVTAASQLMRAGLGSLLHSVQHMQLSGRMNGVLHATIKTDSIHGMGERMVSCGDLSTLAGFEFNHRLSLDDVLPLNLENCYTIEAGDIRLDVPAFRLRRKKALPDGATHYRLVSCVLTIDFDKGTCQREKQVGALQTMGRKAGTAFCIEHSLKPVNGRGCCWLVGVEFYRMVDKRTILVRGGALRVMEVVTELAPHQRGSKLQDTGGVWNTSVEKGRALMALVEVDGNGKGGGEVATGGDDAAAILPEERSLQSRWDAKGLALLDAQQGQGIGRNEKNFHNKEFKSERINGSKSCHAAVIAAWAPGQKESNKCVESCW